MKRNKFYDRLLHKADKYFLRRILVLIVALFVMTIGVSLCLRSSLGSSPISVTPYAWTMAGGVEVWGMTVPAWTVGEYTLIMNAVFVVLQIIVLRRHYNPIQLLQLGIGFVFAYFLDLSMELTAWAQPESITLQLVQLLVGGFVMAIGVSIEVMTRLVMMPGEGITLAFSRVTGADFGKVKIIVDTSMVVCGVIFCLIFFGCWRWDITGLGTLISMFYVGATVRAIRPFLRPVQRFLFGE